MQPLRLKVLQKDTIFSLKLWSNHAGSELNEILQGLDCIHVFFMDWPLQHITALQQVRVCLAGTDTMTEERCGAGAAAERLPLAARQPCRAVRSPALGRLDQTRQCSTG